MSEYSKAMKKYLKEFDKLCNASVDTFFKFVNLKLDELIKSMNENDDYEVGVKDGIKMSKTILSVCHEQFLISSLKVDNEHKKVL